MEPTQEHQYHASQQKAEKELKQVLEQLPEKIPVYLFAQPGENDIFTDSTRQAIQYFGQLTHKITFHESDLNHDQAKK